MEAKGNILDKVKYFIGLDDLDEEFQEEMENEEFENTVSTRKAKNNKVVNIHTSSQIKLVLHEPDKYEDCTKTVEELKNRRPVVLNLKNLEGDLKRKVFDFTSGAIYAIEGTIQKVTKDIFVLAPSNVEIDAKIKDELKNKGLFPWKK
ncbi:MAG: DUF552 domain-containing protein [Firmicutes bacterium]|nr:DUF552 domain-containing protein [Bacillota bacterium]